MDSQNLHETLQQASQQIKQAQESVIQAQGYDANLLDQAEQLLQNAEHDLRYAQHQSGTEATENPQFQQAFEQLHDIRQQVRETQQNINDVL